MCDTKRYKYRLTAALLVALLALNAVALGLNPNEVVVWEHSGLAGDYESWTLEPGMRHKLVPVFPGWLNDEISSIEVGSEVKVAVYRHSSYKGQSKIFEGRIDYVGDYWSDAISSLIVFNKSLADPSGAVLSDTAFYTVTGYEPSIQFFPLPEYLTNNEASYPVLDDYMNDEAEHVLIQGNNIKVELYRDGNFSNEFFSISLSKDISTPCGSQAIGTWKGYQTFRLSGCTSNLEGEVSSLKVRSTEPAVAQSYGTTASAGPAEYQASPVIGIIEAQKLIEPLPVIGAQSQPVIPDVSVVPVEPISRLSGRVYVGEVGVETSSLADVRMELYCSSDLQSLGRKVDSANTDSNGWYGLTIPSGCEFFNIKMTTPSGYYAVGATSVGGKVVDKDTIQYAYPIKDQVLTGNKFWVKSSEAPSKPLEPAKPLEPTPEQPLCPEGCECMPEALASQEFVQYDRCTPEICGYDQDRNPLYCFRRAEPTPEQPFCPEGCECMPEELAAQEFVQYDRCTSEICGYDQDRNPLYCFRRAEPTPEQSLCPEGCECMPEALASQEFVQYDRCSPEICGYDEDRNPLYCFRRAEPTPEQPLCPEGCECMPEALAAQEFGQYERCTPEICGYDQDRNPMYCFRRVEPSPEQPICPEGCECMPEEMAKEAFGSYDLCRNESCGYDEDLNPLYCFKRVEPSPEQPICPEGCECMPEEMAKEAFGSYELCRNESCGYDEDLNPLYCFRRVEPSSEQPGPLPDLTLELFGYEVQTAPQHKGIFPWPPLIDRPTIFQILVRNVGTSPVNESFTIDLYVNGNRECTWTFLPILEEEDPYHQYSPLLPGGTRIYNCEKTFQEGERSLQWIVDTGDEIQESNEANNELITTAKWQPAPDLIVEDVWPVGDPVGGQKSTWLIKIKNIGKGDANVPFLTTFWPEGIAGGAQENFWVQSIPAGKSTLWNTSQHFRSWGKLNITVTTDVSNSVTEALLKGEENNQLEKQFDLAFVDLEVESITIRPKKLVDWDNTTISFTLKNIGTADALQPFKVKLFPGKIYGGLTQPVLLDVDELKAGQSINLEHEIKLLPGDYQIAIEADFPDPINVYFEPDRDNNVMVRSVHVYSQREVFLISDRKWKDVLKLVSLTTWKDQNYQGGIIKYPALIFHLENDDAFDADAIIRFLQQYNPSKVIIVGNTTATQIPIMPVPGINPQTLESLLVASKPTGAGLAAGQITKYDPDGYLNFWADIDKVVISEEDYETCLMASVFASYLDAPLLFDDDQLDPKIFDNRQVYSVGAIRPTTIQEINNRSKAKNEKNHYSLEELQKAYAGWTGTDKVILVNPEDLNIGADKEFKPDKSTKIDSLYTGHSLSAPFLAAAKNEVIISTSANTYLSVDSFVESTLNDLKLPGPLTYLTIIANPRAIPMARENRDTFPALWGDKVVMEEIDPSRIDAKALKLLLITFDASTGSASSADITGANADPLSPAIYEDAVVWQDYRHGAPEIYMYNLSTKNESRITSDPHYQMNSAIFGDKIVWQDNRNTYKYTDKDGKVKDKRHWDIYMYDLTSQNEIRITNETHDQTNPAICGDTIVWMDNRNNNQWDIYMYDISTKTESRITSDSHAQMNPAICGNRIVWQDKRNNNQWDIYLYDIMGSKELRITTNAYDQVFPSISENMIVWDDRRHGIPHVYRYDLSSKTETQLTTGSKQIRPVVQGDNVIWLSEGKASIPPVHVAPPAGPHGGSWLTYFYDLSSGKRLYHQNLLAHEFSRFRQEVDGRYYGSFVNYGKQDRAVGRIFGVTTSDVSAYVARVLFFDDIKPQKKEALLIIREDHQIETSGNETEGPALYDYATSNYWKGDVPKQFDTVHIYSGADNGSEQAPAVNKNIPKIQGLYDDCFLILYSDHGGSSGFDNVVNSAFLRSNESSMQPSIVLDIACATCTPTWGYDPAWGPDSDKGVTFCMENLRRGAMVYMGAVDLSYWHQMFDNILEGVFVDGKTIGEVYLEARNVEYANCAAKQPPWPCGDSYYALIGDPTFKPRWW